MFTQAILSSPLGLSSDHIRGWIIPLVFSMFPYVLSQYVHLEGPPLALIATAVTTIVCWFTFRYVPFLSESNPLSRALLVGYLVGELLIMERFTEFPPMSIILLFLFLYFHAVEQSA